jgi:hypothetical protein
VWSVGSDKTKVLDVLLGRHAALCAGGEPSAASGATPGDLLLAALRSATASTTRQRRSQRHLVRLWISGFAARPFLLAPVAGVKRWAEWQTLAQAAAAQHTGLAAPCQVWFSEAPGAHPVLAVATPSALVAECEHAARQAGCALLQVRPWWSAALNHALAMQFQNLPAGAPRTVAALDADSLTVLCGPASSVASGAPSAAPPPFALAHTLMPPPAADQLHSALSRLAFARSVALGEVVVLRSATAADKAQVREAAALPFLQSLNRTQQVAT